MAEVYFMFVLYSGYKQAVVYLQTSESSWVGGTNLIKQILVPLPPAPIIELGTSQDVQS